jgi:hypothetical protein
MLSGTEAEFWDVIGTKVFRVFLFAIHSHLYILTDFTPSLPRAKVVLTENRLLHSVVSFVELGKI